MSKRAYLDSVRVEIDPQKASQSVAASAQRFVRTSTMRTSDFPSASPQPTITTAAPARRALRAMLVSTSIAASLLTMGLVGQAAASAAPLAEGSATASPVVATFVQTSKYAPRQPLWKRDPVDSIFAKKFRGLGLLPDPSNLTGKLIVKFRDEAKVRAGMQLSPGLQSTTDHDVAMAESILARYGAIAKQWIDKSEGELALLESRAREASGREQPDLAGMIEISGFSIDEVAFIAREINALDIVEFVSIDRKFANLQAGCDPQNPTDCHLPSATCTDPFPGTDAVNRTLCNTDPNADPRPFGCNNVDCCESVGAIDPSCIDEQDQRGWDVFCAAFANMTCGPTVYDVPIPGDFDPCFSDPDEDDGIIAEFGPVVSQFQSSSCVNPHLQRGCNQPGCCAAVCTVDPTCCNEQWDQTCANLVLSGQFASCTIPEPSSDATPDFSLVETAQGLQGFQYYLQAAPRPAQLIDVTGLGVTWRGALGGGDLGFSGQGFALKEMDDFQNLIWEFYQGGDPANNPFLKGGGVRIAALESSAYYQHEDFILAGPAKNSSRPWEGPLLGVPKVIIEPDTLPVYPGIGQSESGTISANHGTNVLGVMIAADNGFGVTGIASNAQGYFFPTITATEGFRAQTALSTCLGEFSLGDVINFSWGFEAGLPYFPVGTAPTVGIFGGVQPVTSSEAFSILIGLGSDLGITSVVAAGAGPVEIVGSSDVDVGAIVVTAIYPGNMLLNSQGLSTSPLAGYQLCSAPLTTTDIATIRFPGSNYPAGEAANEDETADASAWGFAVATTGATTNYFNTSVPNTETSLFLGTNDVPPGGVAPALQVDRLRTYTDNFSGTSAAAAMISGVVARMQAAARQFYGTSLSPAQVRTLLQTHPNSYLQCLCSTGLWTDNPWGNGNFIGLPADSCSPPIPGVCTDECVPADCDCEFHGVGPYPNLQQLPASILGADIFGSNSTDVQVVTGTQAIGFAWNRFQTRAVDGNYLHVVAQRRSQGSIVEGLPYLSTGFTTDVRALKKVTLTNPEQDINNLALLTVSRATRNFVMQGGFIYNFRRERYEFVGLSFLNIADTLNTYPLPATSDFGAYVNPEDDTIDVRIWTCGLGNVGRHTVQHDFIDIVINDPAKPL
jgi:hypothetical protein